MGYGTWLMSDRIRVSEIPEVMARHLQMSRKNSLNVSIIQMKATVLNEGRRRKTKPPCFKVRLKTEYDYYL